jgi:hypothetical protein
VGSPIFMKLIATSTGRPKAVQDRNKLDACRVVLGDDSVDYGEAERTGSINRRVAYALSKMSQRVIMHGSSDRLKHATGFHEGLSEILDLESAHVWDPVSHRLLMVAFS